MLPLSIIIPVPGRSEQLEDTLLSVLENRPRDCEVVVVHCGTYDDPYELTDEVHFVELTPDAGLMSCVQAGIEFSQGEVIHLLACGMKAKENWIDVALEHFDDPQCGGVSLLILDGDNPERILSAGVSLGAAGTRRLRGAGGTPPSNWRLRRIDGPVMEAAFYRREVYEAVGGFSSAVGAGLADIDLALSIKAIGFKTCVAKGCHVTGHLEPTKRQFGFQQGLCAERLFLRHAALAGLVRLLMLHPVACGWQFLFQLPRGGAFASLIGRLCGLASFFAVLRHQRQIQQQRRHAPGGQQVRQGKKIGTSRVDAGHGRSSQIALPSCGATLARREE